MRYFFLALFTLITFSINAQTQSDDVKTFKVNYSGTAYMESDDVKFDPILINEFPEPREDEGNKEMKELKQKLNELREKAKLENLGSNTPNVPRKRGGDPIVEKTYFGTNNSGTPPDHSIAVNSKGKLIAIVNTSLRIYDTNGTIKLTRSMNTFFNQNTMHGSTLIGNYFCDPKVIFDCEQKRFILFGMTCYGDPDSSQLAVAFSTDEDPQLPWHVYIIDADQFNLNLWFDYPKIGISKDEVFISGNMFSASGNYTDGYLYQLDKKAAYTGAASIGASCWKGFAGASKFTLLPISHGYCSNYGDKMYVVSSRSGFGSSNTITLYTIDGKIGSATRTYQDISISPSYSSPADADQMGTNIKLNTGDSRMQDGMYLDGIIHTVHHYNAGNGYTGVYYNRISNNGTAWTSQTKSIANVNNEDFAFPAISSFGQNNKDQTVLITFASSSSSSYPAYKVVMADNNNTLSNVVNVTTGSGYVDLISSNNTTRWGDYSGLSRDFSQPIPTAYAFAGRGNSSSHDWGNIIARVKSWVWPLSNSTINNDTELNSFPNPTIEKRWSTVFVSDRIENITIEIIDINGNKIKDLYKGVVTEGKNTFSFNESALSSGTYFLKLITETGKTQTDKIIIN